MYKIIDLGSEFESTGEPRARLLDTSLVKTASSAIQDYWSTLTPNSENAYLWVIGVSAMEYYGCNNNGDAFHEDDLKKTIPDWERQANIFVHHVNKDPRKGIGKPVFAWYNDEMHRVELVLAIKKSAPGASQIVARIRAGEQMFVSMGCNVAYDVCSICGHESKTRAEYCDHLKFNMKKIIPGGKQVYAINPNPKFFDISIVTRPADPTAFALDKMASERVSPEFQKIGSAELGERAQELLRKSAAVRKMADIIKQVEGQVVDAKDDSVEPVKDLIEQGFEDFDYPEMDYDELDHIGTKPLGLLHALAHHGIGPSLDDAYWMSGAARHGLDMGDALEALPRILDFFGEHPAEIDPYLHHAFRRGMEDPDRHELTMKVVRPVVVQRITIVKRLAPIPIVKTAAFGRPDVTDISRRNFAQLKFTDQYGHTVTTTPYHLRQARSAAGGGMRTGLGALLAMGAIASLAFGPDMTSKLTGGALFGVPALAALGAGNSTYRATNNGMVEVPARTMDYAFKTNVKTASLGATIGLATPALFAMDYGINKWRANQNFEPEPDRVTYNLGRTVLDNPAKSLAGGAFAGAMLSRLLTRGKGGAIKAPKIAK